MKIKKLNFSAILIIFFLLAIYFLNNRRQYFVKFRPQKLAELYNNSQFAVKPKNRKLIIQDEDLYAYAGWQYLKTGQLDKINIEHPPLGKYLIGLSILFFNNQNIGQVFWAGMFLFLLYKLSLKILKNQFFSLLTVFLFVQEKLFQEQLTHSLLDLPLGVFLLLFFLSIVKKPKNKKLFLLIQGIFLGAIASIKYPTVALISFIALTCYYILKKEKKFFQKLLLTALISLFIFLLSYLPFFLKNPQPVSFYSLQLKALKIHLSHVPEYPKGQVFNVLLFNRWLSWWGKKGFVKVLEWNIFWPILTLNFLLTIFLGFFKTKKFKFKSASFLLINLWSFFYLIFVSSRLFFPRYLFLLLPFLYINLCYNFKLIINH